MKKYACSSITGFKNTLDTRVIKVPLRYPENTPNIIDAHEKFHQNISSAGKFITFEKFQSFIDLVSIDILNDGKTTTLSPIAWNSQLPLKLNNIQLQLPNKITSKSCISVSVKQDGDELDLVVDLLDERFLWLTLVINLQDFVVGKGNEFNLSNFRNWGNISVPYSFELKSQPFYFEFIDVNSAIISLNDGTLLHFQRPSPLQDFDIDNFSESTKSSSSLLSGILGREFKLDNRVVSLAAINDLLITLTIDRVIKVYDLPSHGFLNSIKLSNSDSILSTVTEKYLSVVEADGHNYILFHASSGFDLAGKTQFHIWQIDGVDGLKRSSVDLSVPDFDATTKINSWYIQDFHGSITGDKLDLQVLWKSSFSSTLVSYTINLNSFNITDIYQSIGENSGEFLQRHSQEYYKSQVLNSGMYDSLVLHTSVNILRERLKLPKESTGDFINETLTKLAEHDSESAEKPWFILNSLCEEYLKLSKDTLSITVKGSQVVTLQANGLGFYRDLSFAEAFDNDDSDLLNGILKEIGKTLSDKTMHKVYNYVCSLSHIGSEELSHLDENILGDKLVLDVETTIQDDNGILEKIDQLVNGLEVEQLGFENLLTPSKRFFIISSIKDIMKTHTQILTKLIIFISSIQDNERLQEMANEICQRFKDFKLFNILFSNDYSKSVIWNQLMIKGDIQNKYNFLCQKIHDQEYLINVIIGLVNSNDGKLIVTLLIDKIDHDSNKYLVGLIYFLNKDIRCVDLLTYQNYLEFNETGYEFNKQLGQFLGGPIESEVDYYHNLASLISTEGSEAFVEKSIDLEFKAITTASGDVSHMYKNIFNSSLKLLKLDTALKSLSHFQNDDDFGEYLKTFIHYLLDNKKINYLIDINKSDTDLVKCIIRNTKLIDTILKDVAESEPLLSSVKSYDIIYSWRISNSMKRGAIEILYHFITRFEREHEKLSQTNLKIGYLKVLEYYLIILNCLKSYKNDEDRWLIKSNNFNKIVTVQELTMEYSNYIKKLNSL